MNRNTTIMMVRQQLTALGDIEQSLHDSGVLESLMAALANDDNKEMTAEQILERIIWMKESPENSFDDMPKSLEEE
jgi:hypothetical protein